MTERSSNSDGSRSTSQCFNLFHMSRQATPPSGFVHLILLREKQFYLEIPICIVNSLCLRPRKYLRFLGWCALGTVGTLASQEGNKITLDGELDDRCIYQYLLPSDNDNPLAHAADVEVIKQWSQVPSETSGTRENFRMDLMKRDGCCVWTSAIGTGMHIIPYSRGDEWLRLIIKNRADEEDEDIESMTINDIRNGIYAHVGLHNDHFDPRQVVVLKTPNPILETTDVPDRYEREIDSDVSYPIDSRYTLQWIVTTKKIHLKLYPNNSDATFMDQSLPKPADILLHYNYGAAAVKRWGKNAGILTDRPDLPRPTVPAPVPMGPSRVINDRDIAINKRAGTTSRQGAGNKTNTSGEAVDSRAHGGWDEDDIMLFLWGNSRAARERHARKEQERTEYMEKWRSEIM